MFNKIVVLWNANKEAIIRDAIITSVTIAALVVAAVVTANKNDAEMETPQATDEATELTGEQIPE